MKFLEQVKRRPWHAAATAVAYLTLVGMVAVVMAPWFGDVSTYGFHDWDVETSFRYLTIESLRSHREFPGWNPYACGGYPLWGYVEGATNLVSPWLPAYLALPLPLAVRIEAAGMGLFGAVGAYALAGCFTQAAGARLLVAALWAVNGRWGLQTASGHTWHLAYAFMPWCLLFFERARGRRRCFVALVALGVTLAMLVYAGGIYPLPHTVLALGVYAALCAVEQRTLRPLWVLAAGGLMAIGLAAPKLFSVLHTFGTDPRLIPSEETLEVGAFVTLLTHPQQAFHMRPANVRPYGWHEWGMYIGAAGAALLAAGVALVEGRRALKTTGLLFVALGFGAFHRWAPWTLLHEHVPVFRSQHVPSRFLYPAVLLLALVVASGIGRWVDRRRRRAPWLDLGLVLAAAWLAFDVASVAQQPMRQAMWMVAPEVPSGRSFRQAEQALFHYRKRDWAAPLLPNMMANTGVLDCYGVPRPEGWLPKAIPVGDPDYRGEVFLEGEGRGDGSVRIVAWSPNRVRLALDASEREDVLVYNMHHREGWHAELVPGGGALVFEQRGLIAVRGTAGTREVAIWYRPPGLLLGVAVALFTIGCLFVAWRMRRETD